ncbi:MAG: hypothetical protein V3G42_07690 [Oscillospiraceae bacterium]
MAYIQELKQPNMIYDDNEQLRQAMSNTMAMMIMARLDNMNLSDMEKRKIIEKLIRKLQGRK